MLIVNKAALPALEQDGARIVDVRIDGEYQARGGQSANVVASKTMVAAAFIGGGGSSGLMRIPQQVERPGRRHVVVTTPLTGWHLCGGERGPGVAIWLDMMAKIAGGTRAIGGGSGGASGGNSSNGSQSLDSAAALKDEGDGSNININSNSGSYSVGDITFHFVGTAGHELAYVLAMKTRFLWRVSSPPLPLSLSISPASAQTKRRALVVTDPVIKVPRLYCQFRTPESQRRDPRKHAGVAALGRIDRDGGPKQPCRRPVRADHVRRGAQRSCARSSGNACVGARGFPRPIRKGADAAGELGDIIRAGYTAFGAAGAHPQFHTPADDAGTTSQETLLPAARALYDALQAAVQALY